MQPRVRGLCNAFLVDMQQSLQGWGQVSNKLYFRWTLPPRKRKPPLSIFTESSRTQTLTPSKFYNYSVPLWMNTSTNRNGWSRPNQLREASETALINSPKSWNKRRCLYIRVTACWVQHGHHRHFIPNGKFQSFPHVREEYSGWISRRLLSKQMILLLCEWCIHPWVIKQ